MLGSYHMNQCMRLFLQLQPQLEECRFQQHLFHCLLSHRLITELHLQYLSKRPLDRCNTHIRQRLLPKYPKRSIAYTDNRYRSLLDILTKSYHCRGICMKHKICLPLSLLAGHRRVVVLSQLRHFRHFQVDHSSPTLCPPRLSNTKYRLDLHQDFDKNCPLRPEVQHKGTILMYRHNIPMAYKSRLT